jgi:hypothetical protein
MTARGEKARDNNQRPDYFSERDGEMWVLLIIALASAGGSDGGVHSSVTTLQFQTQASCENAAKTINQMTVRSAASSLTVTSSCIQQK